MAPLAFIGHLTAGRAQMGTSLAFHLVFALLGVGLPLLMLIAEGLYLRTGDEVWRALAQRWAKPLRSSSPSAPSRER
jgi:cytochrome bd ubiquinol oxidase subunit I